MDHKDIDVGDYKIKTGIIINRKTNQVRAVSGIPDAGTRISASLR